MKTRKQKVICRVLCMVVSILLLASFFVVPVSALDEMSTVTIQNEIYEYGGGSIGGGGGSNPDDVLPRPYSAAHFYAFPSKRPFTGLNSVLSYDSFLVDVDSVISDRYMYFSYYPSLNKHYYLVYYINQLFDDYVMRTYSKGDTAFIQPGHFNIWTEWDCYMTQFRFVLRDNGDPYSFDFGRVVAATDVIDCYIDVDSDGLSYDRLAFTFTDDVESRDLCLCVEFVCDLDEDYFDFFVEQSDFTISYGPGVSPNYPIYPSAPGGNEIGGLGSAEEELLGSQQGGINEGVSAMDNVGSVLDNLDSGKLELLAFSTELMSILDRIGSIPGIYEIVEISLALGLFASLMALSASIVSASDRRAGQAKREAQREARKK